MSTRNLLQRSLERISHPEMVEGLHESLRLYDALQEEYPDLDEDSISFLLLGAFIGAIPPEIIADMRYRLKELSDG